MKIEQVLSPRRRLLGTFCVKNTKNKRRKGGIIVSENNCFREWDPGIPDPGIVPVRTAVPRVDNTIVEQGISRLY